MSLQFRKPGFFGEFQSECEQYFDELNERTAKMMDSVNPLRGQIIRMEHSINKGQRRLNPVTITDEDRRRFNTEFSEWKKGREKEERRMKRQCAIQAKRDEEERYYKELLHKVESRTRHATMDTLNSNHMAIGLSKDVSAVIEDTYENIKTGEDKFSAFIHSIIDVLAEKSAGAALAIVDQIMDKTGIDPIDRSSVEKMARKVIWLLGPTAAMAEVTERAMEIHVHRTINMHKKLVKEYCDMGYIPLSATMHCANILEFSVLRRSSL